MNHLEFKPNKQLIDALTARGLIRVRWRNGFISIPMVDEWYLEVMEHQMNEWCYFIVTQNLSAESIIYLSDAMNLCAGLQWATVTYMKRCILFRAWSGHATALMGNVCATLGGIIMYRVADTFTVEP